MVFFFFAFINENKKPLSRANYTYYLLYTGRGPRGPRSLKKQRVVRQKIKPCFLFFLVVFFCFSFKKLKSHAFKIEDFNRFFKIEDFNRFFKIEDFNRFFKIEDFNRFFKIEDFNRFFKIEDFNRFFKIEDFNRL